MDAYRNTRLIHIDSRFADVTDESGRDAYNLNLQVDLVTQVMYFKMKTFIIPYTFYQINQYNNLIDITVVISQGITNTVLYNIPVGNYTINELIDWINQNTVLTCSVDVNTMKLTFEHSTLEFGFNRSSTCQEVLGFPLNTRVDSTNRSVTMPYVYNVNPITEVYIHSSLNSRYFVHQDEGMGSVLGIINVSQYYAGDFITYNGDASTFYSNLESDSITSLLIYLTDRNGNSLDFNGSHYVMTFELIFNHDYDVE
jgi:hypothetical protein